MLELNRYFYDSNDITYKFYYLYFDVLLKKEKKDTSKDVKEILKDLAIQFSTYRREKLDCNKRKPTIDILLKHFKINDLYIKNISNYESIIRKIYFNSYLRTPFNVYKCIEELDLYISNNDYLKPILILFKVLAYMNTSNKVHDLKKLLNSELEYLFMFDNSYFFEEFELIHLSIMHFFGYKINKTRIEKILDDYESLGWIYYNNVAGRYYVDKKYDRALRYYQKALDIYRKTNNIERQLSTISNIACIYNDLEEYKFTLDILSEVIYYAFTDKYSIWLEFIIQHYIHALFMLDEYDKIVDLVLDPSFDIKKITSPAAVECILVEYFNNESINIDEIKELYKDDKNIDIILEFIKTNNYKVLSKYKNID